jgi:sRNA-binding regulator protein Hfq
MFRKILSLLIIVLLMQGMSGATVLAAQTRDDEQAVEKVRIKVAKQGLGDKARVTVWTNNGTKVKGFISQAGADDFTVRDRKTGQPTLILYRDVAKLESNRGHSTLRNVLIGVGVGVGAFLAVIAIIFAHYDD